MLLNFVTLRIKIKQANNNRQNKSIVPHKKNDIDEGINFYCSFAIWLQQKI